VNVNSKIENFTTQAPKNTAVYTHPADEQHKILILKQNIF